MVARVATPPWTWRLLYAGHLPFKYRPSLIESKEFLVEVFVLDSNQSSKHLLVLVMNLMFFTIESKNLLQELVVIGGVGADLQRLVLLL